MHMDRSALLRAARAYLGMQQDEAALAAGLSRPTVQNAEAGTVSDKTWRALSAAYASRGVSIGDMDGAAVLIARG